MKINERLVWVKTHETTSTEMNDNSVLVLDSSLETINEVFTFSQQDSLYGSSKPEHQTYFNFIYSGYYPEMFLGTNPRYLLCDGRVFDVRKVSEAAKHKVYGWGYFRPLNYMNYVNTKAHKLLPMGNDCTTEQIMKQKRLKKSNPPNWVSNFLEF